MEFPIPFFGSEFEFRESILYMTVTIGVLYALPYVFVVLPVEVWQVHLNVKGDLRRGLQGHLFRRFLFYDDNTRKETPPGEVAMAMTREIPEIVDNCFVKLLRVSGVAQRLLVSLFFILSENRFAVIPLTTIPIVMACFLV